MKTPQALILQGLRGSRENTNVLLPKAFNISNHKGWQGFTLAAPVVAAKPLRLTQNLQRLNKKHGLGEYNNPGF